MMEALFGPTEAETDFSGKLPVEVGGDFNSK